MLLPYSYFWNRFGNFGIDDINSDIPDTVYVNPSHLWSKDEIQVIKNGRY